MAQYSPYRPRAAGPWSGSFDQLRREMDTLMNRFASVPLAGNPRGVFPAVNLYESTDAYFLTAELPGVAPEDIHVSLEGATVNLHGERTIDDAPDASLHRAERQSGKFRRAFELPASIDGDKVEAAHRNGVLLLRLPKAPEHKPRQIAVQAS